jgi:hypothetical protein
LFLAGDREISWPTPEHPSGQVFAVWVRDIPTPRAPTALQRHGHLGALAQAGISLTKEKKKKKKKVMHILIVNGTPPKKILINRPLIALKFEPKKFND